jgi:hypothetical protein
MNAADPTRNIQSTARYHEFDTSHRDRAIGGHDGNQQGHIAQEWAGDGITDFDSAEDST